MRSAEALKMLKSAGFKHVKTDRNGHQHWELGRHRISISMSQGELDPNIAERVRKLCLGSDRVGDAARGAEHKPVEKITREEAEAAETILDDRAKNLQREEVGMAKNGDDSRLPIETDEPQPLPDLETEILPLGKPLLDENSTLEDGIAALEALAEREHDVLTRFHGRVATYGRLVALSEQLGIDVKPLPFVLTDGLPPGTTVHQVEVEVSLPVEEEQQDEKPVMVAQAPVTRSKIPKSGGRRHKAVINQDTVLDFITERGIATKTEISHWAGRQYKLAHQVMGMLMDGGLVKQESVRKVGAPHPSKVYSRVHD